MDATLPAVEDGDDAWVEGLPRAGELVAGKYRVQRLLGRGGMGAVVEARHVELGHSVAVKLLLPAAARRPEAVARFLREARAVASLCGEHVVRVLDVGAHAASPGAAGAPAGLPYIVMECLAGSDLGDVLEKAGALPIPLAVEYVIQACEAIAEAHGRGIVHRDLKPSNLFLHRRSDGSDVVKVLDFGIAKAVSSELLGAGPAVTATGEAMGSPRYMSPELVRNARDVDARTDVWALGVILYELVSGRSPFHADTVPATCALIVSDPPRPLRSLVAEIPSDLEAAIESCLEKDVDDRMPDVATLARALRPFAATPSEARTDRIDELLRRDGVDPAAVARSKRSSPSSSTATSSTPMSAGRSGVTETASAWGTKHPAAARGPRRVATLAIAALGGAIAATAVATLLRGSAAPTSTASAPDPSPRSASPTPSTPESSPIVAAASAAPPSTASAASAPTASTATAASSSRAPGATPKGASQRPERAPEPIASPAPTAAPTAAPISQPTPRAADDPLLDRK